MEDELITCECTGDPEFRDCPVHFDSHCKPYPLGACCLTWEATRAGHSRSCGNHPDPLPLRPSTFPIDREDLESEVIDW